MGGPNFRKGRREREKKRTSGFSIYERSKTTEGRGEGNSAHFKRGGNRAWKRNVATTDLFPRKGIGQSEGCKQPNKKKEKNFLRRPQWKVESKGTKFPSFL